MTIKKGWIEKMKKLVNSWYLLSVMFAVISAAMAIFGDWNALQTVQLITIAILFLHFFEEFGFPGGFPYTGVKLLLGRDERDKTKWDSNNLSSMYGNWGLMVLVYISAIAFPEVKILTIGMMMFNVLEVLMHLVFFEVRRKEMYNPGLATAFLGFIPVTVYYFMNLYSVSDFVWYDYVIGFVWIIFVFWLAFRSPIYWSLGKIPGYEFTDQTAFGFDQSNK
ncbi:HXXEE domain-containing protein [Weissella confusa]|nr:HXXEE domain-containing protein [Weissella confusa]